MNKGVRAAARKRAVQQMMMVMANCAQALRGSAANFESKAIHAQPATGPAEAEQRHYEQHHEQHHAEGCPFEVAPALFGCPRYQKHDVDRDIAEKVEAVDAGNDAFAAAVDSRVAVQDPVQEYRMWRWHEQEVNSVDLAATETSFLSADLEERWDAVVDDKTVHVAGAHDAGGDENNAD